MTITLTTKQPSPFKGFPTTRSFSDENGNICYTVTPYALKPIWARVSIYLAIVLTVAVFIGGMVNLIWNQVTDIRPYLEVLVLSIICFPFTLFGTRLLTRSTVTITFRPHNIHVRKIIRSRSFDRAHPLGFVLLPHDKAQKEQDRHTFLDRKYSLRWWTWKRKKYYGVSHHVALTCFGERYDILTVYGEKKAKAIQARLKAVDAVVDGTGFGESGISLSPDTDWGEEAGHL